MGERMNALYWLGWYLCRFLAFRLCDFQVEGGENLPKEGGAIIASTHTATLDPVLLGCAFPRPLAFMAKEELFRFPPFAALIRALGAFPVRRGNRTEGRCGKPFRCYGRDGAWSFSQKERATQDRNFAPQN